MHSARLSALLIFCSVIGTALGDDAPSATVSKKSFPITTLINAKWSQTPLYLEIAEYLSDENAGSFWDFVKALTELDVPLNQIDTASKQYMTAMHVARNRGLNALQLPLLKLTVSMHSMTPLIQSHLQLANDVRRNIKDCQAATFIQLNEEVLCNLDELKTMLNRKSATPKEALESYSFDHVFPGSENNTRTAILYADIGSKEFKAYHDYLSSKALNDQVRYILRHYVKMEDARRVRLSGYGVELHLKSTEYKSQDDTKRPAEEQDDEAEQAVLETEVQGFDFKLLKSRFPTLSRSLDQLRNSLLQNNDEIDQLKAWEFQDLGLQAAAAVADVEGDESLQILQFIAHNFPTQARLLLGNKVSDGLRQEVKHNTEVFGRSLNVAPPDAALFVNGLFFDADTLDLGALIESLRGETRVLESLHSNNIKGAVATGLLALDLNSASNQEFAIDIRDTAINWINDIETEAQYRRWPSSVMDLLRPTFPGMLRNIRKNVFNLVLIVNPLEAASRSIIKLTESFVMHQAPVRLGIVFDARQVEEQQASKDYHAMVCAFNYVTQKKDARGALSFLTDVFAAVDKSERVTRKHIKVQMKKSFSSLSGSKLDDILDEDSDYDYGKQLALEFVERLGFSSTPQALLNGVPMEQQLLLSDSDFEEAIFSEIIQQTSTLQKAVYKGDLTDSDPLMDYLMNQPHVMPRLNQRILSNENSKFLDISGNRQADLSNVGALAKLSNRDMTATLLSNVAYFSSKLSTETIGNSHLHFLTLWVVVDLDEAAGRDLLTNALKYLKTASSARIAFIPNCEGNNLSKANNLNRMVWAAAHSMKGPEATDMVLKWLKNPKSRLDEKLPAAMSEILPSTELHMKMLRVYSQRVLSLVKSQRLIVANGKIIGPLPENERFDIEDFGLIDRFNSLQYGDKIRKVLKKHKDEEAELSSDVLMKLYASLVNRQSKTRFKLPEDLQEEHSVIKLKPKQDDLPHFNIVAVLDPASRSAQKLAPILILLRNTLNCQIKLFLTPLFQHSDMPVKNFYRYVAEPEVQFHPNGEMTEGPLAKFMGIPANPLLTQNLQVPENWLVEVVRSVYDLDNIKLVEIGGPVHSEYELEYLLLEGHCFDASTGSPPRGLQVTMGTKEHPTMVDTIVMANLGYFQLKANPGVWELRLREGKSTDIYDIAYAEGPNTVQQNSSTKIVLSSLRSHVIKLRVNKKSGMQNADLLSDDDAAASSGIWNSIANSFGGSSDTAADEDADTINIFSVASGHLYERLLRIMMLSLLKHTKSPVKFWFLKNYLSPQFTDFLPHMAKEYGFRYELVQYKWPRWLHQQTEKQRTIWGYKILFLDVLFPLNVRKIIFVDADAIVRTDIKELYDMDLGGAPYAYTPFCDSRKEMEGFRFWKQGYWRSHLMGRRYHISALYVVDLKRFRRIAAGDRLRGQYQALSQDPNSLSNLDQDLPNNMIHQVAIKSLPDEWLWCQTWCSDSSFKSAKVIDLCNNPQTKEAKLTAAQRIVPEWKDYDGEIKKLMAQVEDGENSEHSEHHNSSAQDEQNTKTPAGNKEDSAKHSEL